MARGFTLLELLVVLAIIGALLATVPTGLGGALPGMRLHAATRGLADALKLARETAVETGTEQAVALDAEDRRLGVTVTLEDALTGPVMLYRTRAAASRLRSAALRSTPQR